MLVKLVQVMYSLDCFCGWQICWYCVVELVGPMSLSMSISSNGLGPPLSAGELNQSDELLLLLLRLPPVDNLRLLEKPIEIDSLADGL